MVAVEQDPVAIDLSDQEWELLAQGVLQLGGPASINDTVSQAIGYVDTAELRAHWGRLLADLKARRPLTARDWRRAQVATEIMFASEYYGAGGTDWEACSGIDDASTVKLLRQVQRKLISIVGCAG